MENLEAERMDDKIEREERKRGGETGVSSGRGWISRS